MSMVREALDSAKALCPKTVALLKSIPTVNAAMFALLPPGGKLGRTAIRSRARCAITWASLTPNSDNCRIFVDGEPYQLARRRGRDLRRDLHPLGGEQDRHLRVILFCDVERPLPAASWP